MTTGWPCGRRRPTNANNTFDHNTVQTPVLANGIAIYGGTDNTVSNNLVADPIREGSGLHVGSRFGAEPFAGHLWITDNTTVRAGTYELNWNIGLGRDLDLRAREAHQRRHRGGRDNFLDNTYNAIMVVADFPVKDLYSITNVHFKDIQVDGTGTSVVSARAAGSASFQNVDARNVGAVGRQQLRLVPLHAGRLGVLADRPRRQRRHRQQRRVPPRHQLARLLPAERHHLQRPADGGRAAGAVGLVDGARARDRTETGARVNPAPPFAAIQRLA